jgi:hypothetical protein
MGEEDAEIRAFEAKVSGRFVMSEVWVGFAARLEAPAKGLLEVENGFGKVFEVEEKGFAFALLAGPVPPKSWLPMFGVGFGVSGFSSPDLDVGF